MHVCAFVIYVKPCEAKNVCKQYNRNTIEQCMAVTWITQHISRSLWKSIIDLEVIINQTQPRCTHKLPALFPRTGIMPWLCFVHTNDNRSNWETPCLRTSIWLATFILQSSGWFQGYPPHVYCTTRMRAGPDETPQKDHNSKMIVDHHGRPWKPLSELLCLWPQLLWSYPPEFRSVGEDEGTSDLHTTTFNHHRPTCVSILSWQVLD